MKLSETLSEKQICMHLRSNEKIMAIRELVEILAAAENIRDIDRLMQAVMAREQIQSTGVGHGVAIPHGQIQEVQEVACVLGLSRRGIEYQSSDNCPVHLLFLLVAPPELNTQYLSTLAAISRLFRDSALCDTVLKARSPAEIMERIRSRERG